MMFLSYSKADVDFAIRLAEDLRASGKDIWIDKLSIPPGDPWDTAVERALLESSEVLLILSPSSVSSPNVMDEAAYALEEKKKLIPVLFRSCRVPLRLRRLQYVDFTDSYDNGLRTLLRTMSLPVPAERGANVLLQRTSRVMRQPAVVVTVVLILAVTVFMLFKDNVAVSQYSSTDTTITTGADVVDFKGQVVDAESGNPVPGAQVVVSVGANQRTLLTDKDGMFASLVDQAVTGIRLRVTAADYRTFERDVARASDGITKISLAKVPPQPVATPPCTVTDAFPLGHGMTVPKGASYGPDQNLSLNLQTAKVVVIRRGSAALLTFSARPPDIETAAVVYDSDYHELAERGTAPAKGLDELRVPATGTADRDIVILITTWWKLDGMAGPWSPTENRADQQNPRTWFVGARDVRVGDFRDIVVGITCE